MTPTVFLAALAAVALWSAGPVTTKLAVAELPVLAVAVARTCLGGIVVLPLALALRLPLPRQAWQFAALVLSGVSGFIFFPLVFCFGMTTASGTHGVLILAFLPVLTGLIANLWDGRVPRRLWWLGCALALCGELLLLRPDATTGLSDLRGDILVIVSTMFLAFGYVCGGRLTRAGYSAQATTYWGVGLASIMLAPLLPFLFDGADLAMVSWQAWACLAYLAFGVTVAGYILWYWALGRGGIAKVGLMQFLQPVSGVILSYFLLREPLSLQLTFAAGLIIAGVVIASRSEAPREKPHRMAS